MVGTQRTFAMIKPHLSDHQMEEIVNIIHESGLFKITQMKSKHFTPSLVEQFYSEHVGKHFFPNLQNVMCENSTICMILEGTDAVETWRNFIGPTNVVVARESSPNSLRAKFGDLTNTAMNAVHGSDSIESAEREISLMFN